MAFKVIAISFFDDTFHVKRYAFCELHNFNVIFQIVCAEALLAISDRDKTTPHLLMKAISEIPVLEPVRSLHNATQSTLRTPASQTIGARRLVNWRQN